MASKLHISPNPGDGMCMLLCIGMVLDKLLLEKVYRNLGNKIRSLSKYLMCRIW